MQPPISKLRKKIIYISSLTSTITLIVSVIFFFVCIIQGIPLKYMIGFIVVYILSSIVSIIFGAGVSNNRRQRGESTHIRPVLYAGANIIIIGTIMLLLERYALREYGLPIIAAVFVILNGIIIEFHSNILSGLLSTHIGRWTFRTVLLIFVSGSAIYGYNILTSSSTPPITNIGQKTSSETTGVLSTIDPTAPVVEIVTPEPLTTVSTGSTTISGSSTSIPSSTATSVSTTIQTDSSGREATGTLATLQSQGIRIDSIESVDGGVTAKIQDGQIIVEVIPQSLTQTQSITQNPSSISNTPAPISTWIIESDVNSRRGGGGLQGVVISAAASSTPSGTYEQFKTIQLSAEGSSGIFFTLDGSNPTCNGSNGLDYGTSTDKSITVKAISCFGGNKIRGPISVYNYSLR